MPGRAILSQLDLPNDPAFAEPWQAQAFAMTVALHERGLFTWPEWAAALSARIKLAETAGYYENWLLALEDLITIKGVGSRSGLDDLAVAWQRAAHATPHGQPIRLENDPAGLGTHTP
jgi:nitrile hydratase accessory protein